MFSTFPTRALRVALRTQLTSVLVSGCSWTDTSMRDVLRVPLVNLKTLMFQPAPCVLLLNMKVATLQLELRERASRATFVLKSYDSAAGAAGTYFAYCFCT